MQFIQFGMLGALGALAIPIIIHLMFRSRARLVDLGTLQFLKVVLRDNAQRRKLRRWLLLALRMGSLALIALLFARPYMLAIEPAAGERLVVVLFDQSASMGLDDGSRPIDQALSEARAILSRAGAGTTLEVATFAQTVHPLADPNELRTTAIEPTSSGTDYNAAMAWARDIIVRSRKTHNELHIFTDLERSGLDRSESVTLPAGVEVHIHDFGRAFPRNVAVTDITTAPRNLRPGDSATITATIFNTSPLPVSKCPVQLHVEAGEKRDQTREIDLEGGATARVAFSLDALPEGLWLGHVEISLHNDLAFDDRRFVALRVAPPVRVLVLDGDPGRVPYESEAYFLQAALRLAPAGERYAKAPFDSRSVDFNTGTSLPSLEKTDVVVLANVADVEPPDAKRLADLVERGGGLLVFTGDHVATNSRALEAAGLGVGTILGPATASEVPWRLERWQSGHPVFKPAFRATRNPGDLRPAPGVLTGPITRIKTDPRAQVLAWFRGDEPALLERAERSQLAARSLWFTSNT